MPKPTILRPCPAAPWLRLLACLKGCLLACLWPWPSQGAEAPSLPVISQLLTLRDDQQYIGPERLWRLSAQDVQADHQAETVEGRGQAMAKSGDDYLLADFARYYQATDWLYLRGNVRIRWGAYAFEADEAEFDLKSQVGWMKNGRMLTETPTFHLSGRTIRKLDERTYAFEDATLTSCEGAPEAWTLRVQDATVTEEDLAELYHPRLRVEGLPVLYFPYLSFSTRTKRTSGLLFPEMGQSTRRGFFYRQPYYLVLDDQNDLTLTEEIMTRRGLRSTVEVRSTPEPGSVLHLRADYLHDSDRAATEADADDQFDTDGLVRPNASRWWLRGKYDGRIPQSAWRVKVDADYVSDQDYLREFPGYGENRNTLLNLFGRDIETRDSLTRTSAALLTRDYGGWDLNAKTAFTEDLTYRNDNRPASENPTVQRLPELSAFVHRTALAGSLLEWEAGAELANLWRRSGSTATRLDLRPRLSLPLQTGIFSLIPAAGLRETAYAVRNRQEDDAAADSSGSLESRTVPEAQAQAFTEFHRVFDLGAPVPEATYENAGRSAWTALRHVLQPRLDYLWSADVDQARLPDLDDTDRLEPQNELRYSLTNILSRKRTGISLAQGPGNAYTPLASTDTQDVLRLRLEQGYDFREAARDEDLDRFDRQPFTDVLADLTLAPGSWVSLSNRTFVSPYSGEITEHEHALTVFSETLGSYTATLDFLGDARRAFERRLQAPVKIGGIAAQVPVSRTLRLDASHSRDLKTGESIRTVLGLTYSHHCYDAILAFRGSPHEKAVALQFVLLGIASPAFGFDLETDE